MKGSHLAPVPHRTQAEEFSVKELRGCTVVSVTVDLDIATAATFLEIVSEAVAAGRPVVIDMSACSYSDSTGLRALAVARPTLGSGSGIVVAAKGTVRRLFEITGFDVALAPYATLAEALENAEAARGSDAYG